MYLGIMLQRLSITDLLLKLKIINSPLIFKSLLIPNFKISFKATVIKRSVVLVKDETNSSVE